MCGRRFFTLLVVAQLLLLGLPHAGARAANDANCTPERESNETPETAQVFTGAGCFTGTSPDGDQDLWIWTAPPESASMRWTFTLDGVRGTVSSLKIVEISSAPGATPITAGSTLLDISSQPGTSGAVTQSNIMVAPGTYILGFSRSATTDGSAPSSVAYRFAITAGDPLPPSGDTGTHDSAAAAASLSGAFALSGDSAGSDDYYAWNLTPAEAARGWTLGGQTAIGQSLTVELLNASGATIALYSSDETGRVVIHDLVLPAGVTLIRVETGSGASDPYVLQAEPSDQPANDREPNDSVAAASQLDAAHPVVKGRLDHDGDRDVYRWTVDAKLAGTLFDAKLIWRSQATKQLCLLDTDGNQLQCQKGEQAVALANLLLPQGAFFFEVSGDAGLDDPYLLRLDQTAAPTGAFETEPNDTLATASTMATGVAFAGRFTGSEDDYIRVLVTGAPQLWRLDVSGTGLARVDLVDADGAGLAAANVASDGTSAGLSDLYFVPGEHWFRLTGANGHYQITLTPLGPPDPNGEREPNNDLANSEILMMGAVKTGRLADEYDRDVYRFSLAATEHVVIKVQSPSGGRVQTSLQWSGTTVQSSGANADGALTMLDLVLKPGDYSVWLTAAKPSESRYQISIERADPFLLAVDQEPNDSFVEASPLPPTLQLTGYVGQANDTDWFQLPTQDRDAALALTLSSRQVSARVFDAAGNEIPVTTAVDGLSADATLPANTQAELQVSGSGPYTIGLSLTPGPKPVSPAKASVDVQLAFETNQITAYWSQGQQIKGTVTLANAGILPQTVQLAAATSHYAWTLALDKTTVVVPPGGAGITVPATLSIQPDAWADVPVRMTVAATGKNGAVATSHVEIDPSRDAAPANPALAWPIPTALLGGLDVASLASGAQVIPSVDQAGEEQLHDGLASTGGGFHVSSATLPLALTVQLAGDQLIPVAGIILDPLNTEAPSSWARQFKLMLSTDGATYTEALSGELQSLPIEQSFVLPQPIEARYAQLVVISNANPNPISTDVSLGEWKVIATPGFSPSTNPINLADLANGGHVVVMNPQFDLQDDAEAIVDPNTDLKTLSVKGGVKPSWTIGFSEERAAEIVSLGWIDPAGSNPDARFTKVTVEVSVAGPLGPWTKVGVWSLDRADDGTVAPFTLDKPVWARFIRFTGNGPNEDASWEYPAQIEVMERANDKDYQSILGQWGYGNPMGPHELINPPAPATLPAAQGNTSKGTAAPLAPNTKASGRVQVGQQSAWYTVTAPKNQNMLTFTIQGDPVADAVVQLFDVNGVKIATSSKPSNMATTAIYVATVQPGQTYTVEVTQPPHSVAFLFDTSISMGPYEAMVRQSLKAFAQDVTPGQEYVNIMPFSAQFLLKQWSDQPYQIQSALTGYNNDSSSSSVEETVLNATGDMSTRDGAKAILLVTDGETGSYPLTSQLWPSLAVVQPRIFAVHVGSGGDGGVSRHLMQDLSAAANGYYQYTQTQGEMDRAFDRLATIMRRPVGFTISFAASQEQATPTPAPTPVNQKPGSLQVTLPAQSGDQTAAVSTDVAVEIILDTSGSMLQELEPGKTRIDVARETLVNLVSTKLPPGIPVALRTFADEPGSCDTILRSPLGPLDPSGMASAIQNVGVTNLVKTPIGDALDQVAVDLASVKGPKIVVLVTDGEETCGGDPAASIKRLAAQGFDIQVNIVGFALDDEQLKATFKDWAQLGHGSYFDASNSDELNAAVDKALAPPFQVFDANGKQVASGRAGGDAISLPPGTYKVVVLSDPTRTFKTVVIKSGKKTKLSLEDGETG